MLSRIGFCGSTALVTVLTLAGSVKAHHSFAPHFDSSRRVNISGTVTQYEARNPHSYLHINAVDENGRTREYVCESHGITQLSRLGITPQLFKVGTRLSVNGPISRHSPYMCFFEIIELADGRKFDVNGPGGSQRTPVEAALPPRQDIFGTWLLAPSRPRSAGGQPPTPPMQLLTPAGEKAVASYDPFKNDPVFQCDPVAVQRVWQAPSTPLEIVRDGANVVLHHEWMDVRRVIHMNIKTHPKEGARSSLGHSIGHWETDTLVIETGNYSAGVLEQYVERRGQPTKGLLHSAALTTVERIHVDQARQRLVVEVDVTDPEFFKQPLPRETMEYSPSSLKIEPFKCSREGLTGTIRWKAEHILRRHHPDRIDGYPQRYKPLAGNHLLIIESAKTSAYTPLGPRVAVLRASRELRRGPPSKLDNVSLEEVSSVKRFSVGFAVVLLELAIGLLLGTAGPGYRRLLATADGVRVSSRG